jgi:hypothetical protein
MAEAESWLAAQPKLPNGKVDGRLLITESERRGYCICPRPLRRMISFAGLTCKWCLQPETDESWAFWYGPDPQDTGATAGSTQHPDQDK